MKTAIGFNTRNKTFIVVGYLLIPLIHLVSDGSWTPAALRAIAPTVAWHWFLWTFAVVFGHVAYLVWKHDFRSSMIWFVKLATDPLTDIAAYYSSVYRLWPLSQARKS